MIYKIPKDPIWCSYCRMGLEPGQRTSDSGWRNGNRLPEQGPCADHRGPDNEPVPYEGPDAYEPSEWVLEVVGRQFRSTRYYFGSDKHDVVTYTCVGYDPRHGFWMVDPADGYQTIWSQALDQLVFSS